MPYKINTMKKQMRNISWIALVSLLFLSSCASSIVYWNQATENFDQGAKAEMTNRFAERLSEEGSAPPAEALPSLDKMFNSSVPATNESPEQLYKMADDKISKALEAPAPLKKENKLANALTLKALSAWKMGKADEARLNAAKALQEFSTQPQPSPRDQPLAKAVPGLVALDLVYDTTQVFIKKLKDLAEGAGDMPKAEAKQLMAAGQALYQEFILKADSDESLAGAQTDLQAAIMLASENKNVRLFLQLCQLTGLKNQFDLWNQLDNFAKRSGLKGSDTDLREWIQGEETSYLSAKNAALGKLSEMIGGTQNGAYRFWDGIL